MDIFGKRFCENRGRRDDYCFRPKDDWKWKVGNPDAVRSEEELIADKMEDVAVCSNFISKKEQRSKAVLIFDFSLSNRPFMDALEENELNYFYISYSHLITGGEIFISNDNQYIKYDDSILYLKDISAVIWSEPRLPWDYQSLSTPYRCTFDQRIFTKRWGNFLKELSSIVAYDIPWFPGRYENGSQDTQQRLGEMIIAQKSGLCVPETICTNSKESATEFYKRKDGKVLFREFSIPPISPEPKLLDEKLFLKELDKIEFAPTFLQEYISKKYEYRTVFIGDRVFMVRIHSQDSPNEKARLDWRHYDNKYVKWELVEAPPEVKMSIIKLMNSLGLKWGSLDLIQDKDDNYYFLEVNRPGSSGWLKIFVDLHTEMEVVKYIKETFF